MSMQEDRFTNLEITLMLDDIKNSLREHGDMHREILEQVKYTNGKVRRLYTWLTIVGTATVTLLFTNGSELIGFIKLVI